MKDDMKRFKNFLGQQTLEGDSQELLTVLNPATGQPWAQVGLASTAQGLDAVARAATAQRAWAHLPGATRGQHLHALADAIRSHSPAIAEALAQESGKSLEDATAEVSYSAEITHYHAEWGRRIEGEILPSDNPDEMLLLQRVAIGVVVCLIPFNFPIYTLLRKVAPALIAGNTVIVRPSNHTPCSALALGQAVLEAGLPPDVLSILVMNHDTAGALCRHAAVGMMSLTGSVAAGRILMQHAQAQIAKLSLELGGKTPVIVLPDADLAAAASGIVASKTSHCGQLCTAAERVLVHKAVYPAMVALLTQQFEQRRWGNRQQDPGAMGPLVSDAARARLHERVLLAVSQGARLVTGGFVPEGPGFFYPPTLLVDCRQDMDIVQEETFGPVLAVQCCDSADQALALANDHQYGLASVLFTEDHRTALQFANAIEAGELYINRMPADPYQGFHAGWKRSGLGGDDGKHGMLEFTQTRLVVMNHTRRALTASAP